MQAAQLMAALFNPYCLLLPAQLSMLRWAAAGPAGFWQQWQRRPLRFNPPTYLVEVSAQLLGDNAAHIRQHLSLVLQAGWQRALRGQGLDR